MKTEKTIMVDLIESLNLDQPQIVSFIQPEPSVMKQADKEKEFSHDELAYILRGLRMNERVKDNEKI